MKTVYIDPQNPSYRLVAQVAKDIDAGKVMVYPTDTIYGFGCDVFSKKAINKIVAAKKREGVKPFSFVCRDISQASEFAFVPTWTYRLMSRILPGPYTVILTARRTNMPKKMTGKRNTVGVRIPDLPLCKLLMELLENPIVSTSVNIEGEDPLFDPADLPPEFAPYIDTVIDGGPIISEPSTVVDCSGNEPVTIREGKGEIVW